MSIKRGKRPGWMFWVLAPFFIVFVLFMTFYVLVFAARPIPVFVILVLDMLCVFGFLSFLNPTGNRWAVRGAGLIVFLIYIGYLVAMLIESGGKFTWSTRRSETTVLNAILGLIVFGIPGLTVAIKGRLPFFFKDEDMDMMGNRADHLKMMPQALKERFGEAVQPVAEPEVLHGKWTSVLKGFMSIPDEKHTAFEFSENGTWSDGQENVDVAWGFAEDNILVLQYRYEPIPEVDEEGGLAEEAYYVYATESGNIILSNADTSVLIELRKRG